MRFLIVITMSIWAAGAYAAPRAAIDPASKPDLSKAAVEASRVQFTPLAGRERSQAIERIEAYLSGLTTLRADFTQQSSDGAAESGKFFMKRPGKLRWQYNPPTSLLLVSNGATLTYYDPSVKQVTYVGVDDTLASFVAQPQIALDGAATRLTRIEANKEGRMRVTVVQRRRPEEGSLTLELADKPLSITGMTTVDSLGNETMVSFKNQVVGQMLNDALFTFVDPRGANDRRKSKRR